MLLVNFMPWRQAQLQQRGRRWAVIMGMLLLLPLYGLQQGFWQYRLNQQQEKGLAVGSVALQHLSALHARTAAQQKQLAAQQQQVQQRLQQRQVLHRWLAFMQQLSDVLPVSVWLTEVKKQQQRIVIQGFSHSITALHDLRHQLRQSADVRSVELGALSRSAQGDVHFSLTVQLSEEFVADE